MANINKNELYNLICEYYENNALQENGYSMREWANLLGVSIAPATITALVREGLLVVEDINPRHYRKAYTQAHKRSDAVAFLEENNED